MNRNTEFLTTFRRIVRANDLALRPISMAFGLTVTEATVVVFLHNNPEKDTAADVAELRMLSKGNVSQAVEGLMQKGLLRRRPDTADRRKIHLELLPAAAPITREMEKARAVFEEKLFAGFSPEERRLFAALNSRFMQNTKRIMDEGERNGNAE